MKSIPASSALSLPNDKGKKRGAAATEKNQDSFIFNEAYVKLSPGEVVYDVCADNFPWKTIDTVKCLVNPLMYYPGLSKLTSRTTSSAVTSHRIITHSMRLNSAGRVLYNKVRSISSLLGAVLLSLFIFACVCVYLCSCACVRVCLCCACVLVSRIVRLDSIRPIVIVHNSIPRIPF